ncbi:MAG: mandelate racemase/muconate lactonizing enzyme family protein, partial [Chloroflexota bacterium]|nr:mandelate racemase/muconate lactonizing enzyme family protein [Chloroflexota bacterium]
MKITDLKSYVVKMKWDDRPGSVEPRNLVEREFIFVQIDTDEGITGWGEITNYPGNIGNRAMQRFTTEIKDFLVGRDPTRIEEIWARTFRLFTYTGTRGATTAAISGIDIALWDIFGKSLGLPIYKLLGGAVREMIPLYTHPPEPGSDINKAREDALEIVASGHKAFKMDPMMHSLDGGNVGFLDGEISAEGAYRAEEITAEVRDAVGPDVEILIDAHGRFNVPTAIDLANRLEPYGIHWFEEPVPVESYHAIQQVRDSTAVRISVGERLHTRFEFIPIFENNLADYVMPDVTWTGGITELKKISTMAEAYYIPVSPHDASG